MILEVAVKGHGTYGFGLCQI